jgi:signal transduction histidine kinase
VLRLLRSSAELVSPWVAAGVVGIAAEWSQYGWGAPHDWVPDLLTGWVVTACGLLARELRPESRSGSLLAATGFAWFAPNFATIGGGPAGWLAAHAVYLHRGPLVQLVLLYPLGRVSRGRERAVIAVGYAVALVMPIYASPTATIVVAPLLVLVGVIGYLRSVGIVRRQRVRGLQATAFVSIVLTMTSAIHLSRPSAGGIAAALHLYQASLCVLAVALVIGLIRAPWQGIAVTDLVVELGEARTGTLRGELARTLGDPTLQVGYWLPELETYVDASGRPLTLPGPDASRTATAIDRQGAPLAVLVHDPAILGDPALVDAVAAAAALAAANARLQTELHARLADVVASRRRIVAAADWERRRLEHRLNQGAQRLLEEIALLLNSAQTTVSDETGERVARARGQLAQARDELRRFARGVHPRELSERGLVAALESLLRDFPVPVELHVPSPVEFSAELEACAYFVCSEALANVAKYASASHVRVSVTMAEDVVAVELTDDGRGGADPDRGTGLRGLADRVETLGGQLTVDSEAGRGTIVRALIPARA